MRFLAVRARAFGPLRDRELRLRPGMNVLYGPNEAGKSSWHAAIFAGLCGMRRVRGARSLEEKTFIERHRPWTGDTWSVEVDVELADGRRIQIVQNFDEPAESRALDLLTGADVTGELIRDGAPDGAVLLGLTRETLPKTICIRQAEVLAVLANAGELQEQLQKAAASGRADETAEAAIARIRTFSTEQVGVRRRNSTRPLQVALQGLDDAGRKLAEARRAHDEYLALVGERKVARGEARDAERELLAARSALLRTRVSTERARVARARSLASRFPEGAPPDPAAGVERLSALRQALSAFDSGPATPPPREGPGSQAIEAEIRALPDVPPGDLEPASEVVSAAERWRAARREVEVIEEAEPVGAPAPDTGGLSVPELRALADALEVPLPAFDGDGGPPRPTGEAGRASPSPWRPALLGVGATLAIVGLVMSVFAPGLPGVGLATVAVGVAVLIAAALRRSPAGERSHDLEAKRALHRAAAEQAAESRRNSERRLSSAGLAPDPARLRALANEVEDSDVVRRGRERWVERLERARETERRAAERLHSVVTARLQGSQDAAEDSDPESLLRRYRLECENRARRSIQASRRHDLERALRSERSAEDAAAEDLRKRRAAEERILAVARSFGVEDGALEHRVARLREIASGVEQEIAQLQRDREAWAALQELLAGRDLAELEADLERLVRAAPPPVEGEPELDMGPDPEARLRDLEKRLEQARGRLERLSGRVEAHERDLADVSAAEEARDRAQRELTRVETLEVTLGRTLEFLEAARDRVQRDIAPRLASAVESRLASVTGNRYHEALVDPANLEVKVRARGQDWRKATSLSHGTAEQVYLLVRIALAEHLATFGEPAPLLLDDVTVQIDAARSLAFLDLVHRISRERQVVLFSQEQEVVSWARATLVGPEDLSAELSVDPVGISCVVDGDPSR